jgi:hypothetical protein
MTPDKEPSAAENFLVKSTRCVKDGTLVATSSLVAPATLIFKYEDSLTHIPKM